jgi:hypothetical protein
MARIIPAPDRSPSLPRRVSRYPWEEWADGNWWEAVQGVDYTCKTSSFVIQVKQNLPTSSWRTGPVQVVVIEKEGEPDRVQFRATEPRR